MPRIICKRSNASVLISGVSFEKCDSGMISEEVSQEVADRFTVISGYEIAGLEEVAPKKPSEDLVKELVKASPSNKHPAGKSVVAAVVDVELEKDASAES